MPVYRDGKRQTENGTTQQVNVSQNVNVDAIAEAVVKAMENMPNMARANTGDELVDNFNNENSMSKLADAMVIQRGEKASNFDDLGGTKETKKDQKDVDKTIDLLKGLND